ncbi:MAG: hypothetical protein ACK2UA_12015, partial [Anaerolineae bacterium]
RFVDPTGYFEEDQLRDWYGDDWRSLFNAIWQDILLIAEFGDVILYDNDLAAMFVQTDGGGMTAWSMSTANEFSGQGEISFLGSVANSDPTGLYRSKMANMEGGPSQGHMEHSYPTDAGFRDFSRRLAWKVDAPSSITLGYHWYRSAFTNQHVQMAEAFVGFSAGWADLGSFSEVTGWWFARKGLVEAAKQGVKALAVELGGVLLGPATVALLGAEVYSWTTWDTTFTLNQGVGLPPIVPAPKAR